MCKNCFDCKNAKISFEDVVKVNKKLVNDFEKISENKDSSLGDMYGKCLKGNTEKLIKLYKEYGNKNKSECNIELNCFEKTDFAKATDELLNVINKVMSDLK